MKMTNAYIEAALWSTSTDDGMDFLDNGEFEVSREFREKAAKDCQDFFNKIVDLEHNLTDEQLGHDFWLTRNGHGTGFWDRGLGEVGKKLSNVARSFGPCELYVGDDNRIYSM